MLRALALFLLLGSSAVLAAEPAVAPAPAPTSPAAPATPPPEPAPTVAVLRRFVGTWEGEQVIRPPGPEGDTTARITLLVRETYRMESVPGKPETLVGDSTYSLGTGPKARTHKGVSRTWIDAEGKLHAEITQDGRTEKFAGQFKRGWLLFSPEKTDPTTDSLTCVRITPEGQTRRLDVIGHQLTPKGRCRIRATLHPVPAKTPPPAPPAGR